MPFDAGNWPPRPENPEPRGCACPLAGMVAAHLLWCTALVRALRGRE